MDQSNYSNSVPKSLDRYVSRTLNGVTTAYLIKGGHTKVSTEARPIEYPILFKPNSSIYYTKVDNRPNQYDRDVQKIANAIIKLRAMGFVV